VLAGARVNINNNQHQYDQTVLLPFGDLSHLKTSPPLPQQKSSTEMPFLPLEEEEEVRSKDRSIN
jgi:hypothetical protein